MNWVILTLIGAPLNAITNLGYKLLADTAGIYIFTAMAISVASALLLGLGRWRIGHAPGYLLQGKMPLVIIGMAIGTCSIMILFLSAFSHGGPISLVDPLLACTYALVSIFLGVAVLKERPTPRAMAGICLYFAGAALMAFG